MHERRKRPAPATDRLSAAAAIRAEATEGPDELVSTSLSDES
jgi:hypothetical protein